MRDLEYELVRTISGDVYRRRAIIPVGPGGTPYMTPDEVVERFLGSVRRESDGTYTRLTDGARITITPVTG